MFIDDFLGLRDPEREAACDIFTEKLLRRLIDLVTAKDKCVRTRCCQLVHLVFNRLAADELDEDFLDNMQDLLLLRLEDKVPAVRAQAASALPRLCNPGDVCPTFCLLLPLINPQACPALSHEHTAFLHETSLSS